MQKSVQARKNRIISAMSGQFQSELPIFKTNRNTNRDLKEESIMSIVVNIYYSGENGSARKFAKELPV